MMVRAMNAFAATRAPAVPGHLLVAALALVGCAAAQPAVPPPRRPHESATAGPAQAPVAGIPQERRDAYLRFLEDATQALD